MKTTLTTHQVASELFNDKNAGWSYQGAMALAEYLEQYEQDSGDEMELDVVAIRCDYSEFASLIDWANDYFGGKDEADKHFGFDEDTDDDDKENAIRDYVQDNGQLIEFNGGIIVSSF